MNVPTKHAKTIDVIDHPYTVQEIRTEYTCPCCKMNFYNGGPSKKVKVFVCDCGQELKIRSRVSVSDFQPNQNKVTMKVVKGNIA